MKNEEICHNFCQNIRHLRKVNNLTQKEMAQIMGISTATLGRMERATHRVRIDSRILCRVCDHFGYRADELLCDNWQKMLGRK